MKNYCNVHHMNNPLYIHPESNTLICDQCYGSYISEGKILHNIKDYSIKNALKLKQLRTEAYEILSKLEDNLSGSKIANENISKVQNAFSLYIQQVNNLQEKIINQLRNDGLKNNSSMAQEFCSLTEEINAKNMEFSKSLIGSNIL